MRGLVQRVRRADPDAARSIAVISHFDDLNARQAPLQELARAAAEMTASTVLVWDLLNARSVVMTSDAAPSVTTDSAPIRHELPQYGAIEIQGNLYVSIQTAAGSIGVIRLEKREQEWHDFDFMVAERLAASVAIEATRVQHQQVAEARMDPASLVQLVTTGLDQADVQLALTRAQLPADCKLLVIIVRSRRDVIGPHVAARLVVEGLSASGILARATTIDALGLVVAAHAPGIQDTLMKLCESSEFGDMSLSLGMGTFQNPSNLSQSWEQAVQALNLVSPRGDANTLSVFNDLGALALIGRIPPADVEALPDIAHLRQMVAADPLDLQLLEIYCETASMRMVAQYTHMHHSSVDYRLKRIAKILGFDLGSPSGRLRALLAVKLLRVRDVDKQW